MSSEETTLLSLSTIIRCAFRGPGVRSPVSLRQPRMAEVEVLLWHGHLAHDFPRATPMAGCHFLSDPAPALTLRCPSGTEGLPTTEIFA